MIVKGIKTIKDTFDFCESIIDNISIDDSFLNIEIKVLYFWNEPIGCKDKKITITCHNCIKTNINLEKAIMAVKNDGQDKIYAFINEFIIEEKNYINLKIRSNFDETIIDITCDDIWINY